MIAVENLCKTFKLSRQQRNELGLSKNARLDAVKEIDFVCRPGRIFTLIGPNGAGKTTALRMIATLMKPTKGSIRITDIDAVKYPQKAREKIGFLTGSTRLYERLTPGELVKYYADLHRMDGKVFRRRKDELFSLLGMTGFASRRIGKLSTGERQKVSIVRTIIHDPDVIVFDEPTVGLDVITSKNIITLIRRLKEEGKTVLFSTHIMGEVSLLSDDMAIIHQGRLRYCGTYSDFRDQMKTTSMEEEFIRRVQEAV